MQESGGEGRPPLGFLYQLTNPEGGDPSPPPDEIPMVHAKHSVPIVEGVWVEMDTLEDVSRYRAMLEQ